MDNLYINVFCDKQGTYHYSTEEFSVAQDKLPNFKVAAEDAFRFSVLGNLRYICTLSHNDTVSSQMRTLLKQAAKARYEVETNSQDSENYTLDELLETVEMLMNT